MVIALKQNVEQFIEDQVRTGRFESAAELVEAAIARLMIDDPIDALTPQDIAAIEESDAQIALGQVRDFREVSAELRAKYLSRE